MKKYDSRADTLEHIKTVKNGLALCIQNLIARLVAHDQTKLEEPEKSIFDKYTPELKNITYGSKKYQQFLKEVMKLALDHHYTFNDHHPEYYNNGIADMDLFALIEMLIDWYAATKRHNDGDINKSIEINQDRFGYSDELKAIFYNTINTIQTIKTLKGDSIE